MFSLLAFLPLFFALFSPRNFLSSIFACALLSERLDTWEKASECCERCPGKGVNQYPSQPLGPEGGSLRDSCPSGCEGDQGSVRGGSVSLFQAFRQWGAVRSKKGREKVKGPVPLYFSSLLYFAPLSSICTLGTGCGSVRSRCSTAQPVCTYLLGL